MIFKEYKDWIDNETHTLVLQHVMFKPKWRFGQVSDESVEPSYPMWFQTFYNHVKFQYNDNTHAVVKELGSRFEELCPDDYQIVRVMASSNTFGLDGDYHTDWPDPDVSITGILYTDKMWQRNWGGDTVFVGDDILYASEYKPRKLITFDSSIPHIGKGPQRRCREMRSILAYQAVQIDALKERMSKKLNK